MAAHSLAIFGLRLYGPLLFLLQFYCPLRKNIGATGFISKEKGNSVNTEGLVPFKPGQSGNPAGRPRGSKNRSTVLRELMELAIEGETLDGKKAALPVETHVIQALVRKAMTGDVSAIKETLDTAYGKVADKSELSGPNGGPIETQSNLSEVDKQILEQYKSQIKDVK